MVKLKDKDIKHVAKLAQLSLSKSEIVKFKKQLSDVIGYVQQLNEVDTKGVVETSQTTGLENALREDKIDASRTLTQDEALSGTDKTNKGYFLVPMILKERTAK